MGYSHSIQAQTTYEEINKLPQMRNGDFISQHGDEEKDGSIVGRVYKRLVGNEYLYFGRFRIERNGEIKRFPGLRGIDKAICELKVFEMEVLRTTDHEKWIELSYEV